VGFYLHFFIRKLTHYMGYEGLHENGRRDGVEKGIDRNPSWLRSCMGIA
jgi:hypothetical protein